MTCRALIDRRLAAARLGCADQAPDDDAPLHGAVNVVAFPLAQQAEALMRQAARVETRSRRLLTLVESLVFRRRDGARP